MKKIIALFSVLLMPLCLGGCSRLGAINAVMPKDAGSERVAESVSYADNPRHTLDIYAPTEATDALRPVVFFIYGGGWDSGKKAEYGFVGRALAARGFVTVIADYRLVPEVRYPDFLADSQAALLWLADNIASYGGDPHQVFLAGHSAGAYNAIMLATDPQFWQQAEQTGELSILAAAGLAGPYDFLPLAVPATQAAFGHIDDEDALNESQPVNIITGEGPPLYLATGEADETVLPRNSRALANKAESLGRDVEYQTYPGLGHAGILLSLSKPFRNKAPILDEMTDFFRSHIRSDQHSQD